MKFMGYRLAAVAGMLVAHHATSAAQGPGLPPINGISCDAQEGQRIHIHQHLVILDHGKPLVIPSNVGRPEGAPCLYWLHTHTPDGFIHIEAPKERSFTLGDFFAVWGQPLTASRAATAALAKGDQMKLWVNGAVFTHDPKTIKLLAHSDIVIQMGPPYTKPAPFTAWGTL
jgi:hypothetical protein